MKQVKDQLLRSLAEAENTRRIAQCDVQDARNFAVKSFAKSLLETSDNLAQAMEVVPEDMRHDKEKNSILVNLCEGIEMTEKELMKAFSNMRGDCSTDWGQSNKQTVRKLGIQLVHWENFNVANWSNILQRIG